MAKKATRRPGFARTLQARLALGYFIILAVLLVLMNTYPLLMSENLMFRTQQATLQNRANLLANTLTTADELTPETVEQALLPIDDLDVERVTVTDEAGLILYDTEEPSGKYLLSWETVDALKGNDASSSEYKDAVFFGRAAAPIMNRNTVVGSVCLYDRDSVQGALLQALQRNLRIISVVVCLAALGIFVTFSRMLTRRVGLLLDGIRTVREGEYTHRVSLSGRDELSQLAEEFNQLTDRLQTTEAERRRFVSDASHELKTPLASIRLLTDSILQDEEIDRETAREFVADIGESTDRLIRISQELLALNRLDEGKTTGRAPIDLSREAENICRLLTPQADSAGVALETDLGADCVARCSREGAGQILQNLIENAIKYNVPDGQVLVTTRREGDAVRLDVADTGMGIPEEDLPRIFERFYRVDKARSRAAGGTGLGLSIVRDTVALYGGEITVAPGKEAGVCFSVTLPAWKEGEE